MIKFTHDMGLPGKHRRPRWEVAGHEMGRQIYHRRWGIQDGNCRLGDGKRNLPQEMGHPRWELAGRETGRGIYHRWDIQDGNWQVGRREEEFTTGDGTSKMGTLAGRETGRGIYHRRWDIQDGNWQVGRREEEFTTGDGTSKMGTGR